MHRTVMLGETVDALAVRPGGRYIDGTVGGGGHAEAILSAGAPSCRLLGVDRDAEAVERCRERLRPFGARVVLLQACFSTLLLIAPANGFGDVDGIILDLGISSWQLDEGRRGFSFQNDGPLDMRMDTSGGETAADLLRRLGDDWRTLATLLRDFGEEPGAVRIARAIVEAGREEPVLTTGRLAEIVERAVGGRRGAARHPATRTFQALRIAVNAELEALEAGLLACLKLLRPGGRLAVISFHSLEDRLVKQTFAAHAGRWEALQQGGERWVGREPAVTRITRKPLIPGSEELESNPRARSAKLRIVERTISSGTESENKELSS